MRVAKAVVTAYTRILELFLFHRLCPAPVRAHRRRTRPIGILVIGAAYLAYGSCAQAQSGPFEVIKVTNLNDSGPGSLRECVKQTISRVCVFEVSGRIKLSTELVVDQPNLFIAGQTAPSPGITVTNAGVTVQSHEVRIEHLAIRVGDDPAGPNPRSRDSLNVEEPAYNVTFKNLSVSWGVDENFSTFGKVSNVVVADSIISEALHRSIHPKGPHSMAALVGEGARNVTFIGNLFAANNDRNVRWKFDTTGEMVNNVIYGWGGQSSWNTTNLYNAGSSGGISLDVIGNVYIPGPNGSATANAINGESAPSGTQVFIQDNIASKLTNLNSKMLANSRVVNRTAPRTDAQATFALVMSSAGMRPWDRDPDDKRVIDGLMTKTLTLRDQVGVWPQYPSNRREVLIRTSPIDLESLATALRSFEGIAVAQPSPMPPPPLPAPLPPAQQSPTSGGPTISQDQPPAENTSSAEGSRSPEAPATASPSPRSPDATPTARPSKPTRHQVRAERRASARCRSLRQTLPRRHPARIRACRARKR